MHPKIIIENTDRNQIMNNTNYDIANPDDIAKSARTVGIISFFFGVIFLSIAAIRLATTYKRYNNGKHCGKSLTGLICGISSLVIWVGGIIALLIWYFL